MSLAEWLFDVRRSLDGSSAWLSRDGVYRYLLTRRLGAPVKRWVTFIMLNPSVADALIDDPTVRRCKSFAAREEASQLTVVNLFAFRATKPADMAAHVGRGGDIVGPLNVSVLHDVIAHSDLIICAWGDKVPRTHGAHAQTIRDVVGTRALCLGTTKAGAPRHPLYRPRDTPLCPFGGAE